MSSYEYKYHKYLKKNINNKIYTGGASNYGTINLVDQNNKNLTLSGSAKLKNCVVESKLVVNGLLNFSNLRVNKIATINGNAVGEKGIFEKLSVFGSFDADKCEIKKLSVSGSFNAKNTVIKNTANISGSVRLTHSTINNIEILSQNAKFKNCKINELVINSEKDDARVVLNHTDVKKIVVRNKMIKIFATADSKIGKVVNATIVIIK